MRSADKPRGMGAITETENERGKILRDGRIFIVVVLALYFGSIYLSSFFMPYDNFWSHLQVQAFPEFDDLLPVTRSCDLMRTGVDPIQTPENKPGHVIFNYPRIWLSLRFLGVSEQHTNAIAVVSIAAFFITALLLIGPVATSDRLLYTLIFCSPAVMLGAARGSTDLIVFVVVGGALLLLRSNIAGGWAYAVLLFAALLKYFPIFSIALAMRESPRRFWTLMVLFVCVFVFYLWISRDDIRVINQLTPRPAYLSFGARVIFERWWLRGPDNTACAIALTGLALILGVLLAARLPQSVSEQSGIDTRHLDAFRVGAVIYCGVFALLLNNGIYRMIFVILCLPQMLIWKRQGGRTGAFAMVALGCVLLSAWLPRYVRNFWQLDQLSDWLLFIFFVQTIVASAPKYLKKLVFIR